MTALVGPSNTASVAWSPLARSADATAAVSVRAGPVPSALNA